MIQKETYLNVADNSGAKLVKCIKVLNKTGIGHIGDVILVSIRGLKSASQKSITKGQIFKALIIRTKKGVFQRKNGYRLLFESNDVVLLSTNDKLVGSRIFGPVTRELRQTNYLTLLSQAKQLL